MVLVKLIVLLAALFAASYVGLFGYLLLKEYTLPKPGGTPHQAMVVLGAQVTPTGAPSKQLELRLELALAQYQKQPGLIVVTGAQGRDEPMTEASAMRHWLMGKGVPAEHILMDESSFNTRQNLENAKQLLPPGTRDVLIITSDYHLPRAMSQARDLGFEPLGVGSPILPEYWLKNHARETLAWGKYFVNKYLPFVPID